MLLVVRLFVDHLKKRGTLGEFIRQCATALVEADASKKSRQVEIKFLKTGIFWYFRNQESQHSSLKFC